MLSLAARLDPTQTALMVIDVQNDFCHREGGLALSYGAHIVEDIEKAMPNVHSLIGAARSAGVLIVFVRSIYDEQYLSPAMKDQKERRGSNKICQTGSWGAEFYGGLAPDYTKREISIVKHRFNAFSSTNLDQELHQRGITRLITCGFTTSVCVESTSRDAFFRDYFTAIAGDAVAEYDRELHESTLKIFNRSFGPVLTLHDIKEVWTAPVAAANSVTRTRQSLQC